MKRLIAPLDAQQRPTRNAHGRCEANVTPLCHEGYRGTKLHARDSSPRCRRIAAYEHSDKKLCPAHASMLALEWMIKLDKRGGAD